MRPLLFFLLLLSLLSCKKSTGQIDNSKKYIFFLHNAFLETHELNEEHPEYGRAEYSEILQRFKDNNFNVISEKRTTSVDVADYAMTVVEQIEELIANGIDAINITVIGTSKGGYIAQYVSTIANNPKLNFVFIGCFRESDIQNIPDINWCGKILNIYEKSDPAGNSGLSRKETSSCQIENYEDLELNTGLRHGFLFKALDAWMQPAMDWADGNYEE